MDERNLAGCRVLVVEDDYSIAAALAEELADQTAIVIGPAPSVERALKLVDEAARLDLAVLDVNLRGEEVYPVADVLAERGIPFVLVTGYDRHTIRARYLQECILEKPVGTAAVLSALRRLPR
ncbi:MULTISPECIES: response regulator [Luteimonas]|uniref:Response regulatory domain-containing protein n=1 Tax=Luteimonas chenhongjianii TaxID=2006110 RepID=A0A290XES9_9GAMM|nr:MULTISPECIES: response regulator [Luteimonas]ATD67589.1 hypothetical protein CNR27_09200 [Luteimonas chenhongjianii]RPD88750.1 response regulator [Luteimonas sp. 100069]